MKKRILSLLCVIALMAGMVTYASAEDGGIKVQLDGELLTFSDAAPEAVSGRTFLPFRAVFEAMGATVGFEGATSAVVATRGARTMRMVVGAKEATVTENGIDTVIPMDVAAYAKNNRTYVPVRFAAEAFGCNVGWDGKNQTVIIVDLQKLVDETLAGKDFALYGQYMSHQPATLTGNQSITGKFSTSTGIMDMESEVNGVISTGTGATEMTTKISMDMSGLLAQMGMPADDAKVSGTMQMRGKDNAFYMTATGDLASYLGLPNNAWLSSDNTDALSGITGSVPQLDTAITADSLQGWNSTMKFELAPSLVSLLGAVKLSDSTNAMETIKTELNKIAAPFRDSSFTKTSTGYTTTMTLNDDPKPFTVTLDLTYSGGKVTGYKTAMKNSAAPVEGGTAYTDFTTNYTAANKMEYQATQVYPDGTKLSSGFSFQVTPSSKSPQTQPPSGATILTAEDMAALNSSTPTAKVTKTGEAAALVKGTLDAYYKGSCDSDFLTLTGMNAQKAKQFYEYNLEAEYEYLCYQFEIDDAYLSASNRSKLKDILAKAYAQAKYSVTATALSNGEYSVRVDLTPCNLFEQVILLDWDSYAQSFNATYESTTDEQLEAMSDVEYEAFWNKYENDWAAGLIQLFQTRLSAGGNQGKVTTKLVLLAPATSGGLYHISEEDFNTIDSVILSY